jgi:hypothetical protein
MPAKLRLQTGCEERKPRLYFITTSTGIRKRTTAGGLLPSSAFCFLGFDYSAIPLALLELPGGAAVLDFTTPAAGFGPARFNEVLELPHVSLYLHLIDLQCRTCLLSDGFRSPFEMDFDLRVIGIQRRKP